MRLFVAVDVPDGLRAAVEEQVAGGLRGALPDAKWTRPEGRHLTLKFLGEVPEERVDEVSAALRAAAAGHAPFTASFDRVGGFPNLGRPRVVWVGVGEGAEPMAELAASISEACEPLGFEAERRRFTGHLTLARIKRPKKIGELPAVEVPADEFDVNEVVLFRSQLHPKGARYTVLERFPLEGKRTSMESSTS